MAQQRASWTAAPDAGVVAGATSALTTTSVRFGGRAAARTARPRLRLLPLRVGCWRPLTWQSDASTIQHCRIGLGVKRIVVCSPASPPTHCCGQGHGCDARAADKDTAADSSAESCSNKKRYMRGRFSFETDLRHRKNHKTRFKRKPAEPKVSVSVRRASVARICPGPPQ